MAHPSRRFFAHGQTSSAYPVPGFCLRFPWTALYGQSIDACRTRTMPKLEQIKERTFACQGAYYINIQPPIKERIYLSYCFAKALKAPFLNSPGQISSFRADQHHDMFSLRISNLYTLQLPYFLLFERIFLKSAVIGFTVCVDDQLLGEKEACRLGVQECNIKYSTGCITGSVRTAAHMIDKTRSGEKADTVWQRMIMLRYLVTLGSILKSDIKVRA